MWIGPFLTLLDGEAKVERERKFRGNCFVRSYEAENWGSVTFLDFNSLHSFLIYASVLQCFFFFLSSFAPSFPLKTLFYFAVLSVKYNVHTWVLQIDRLWRQSWTKKSFPEKGKKFSLVYNGKNFGGFMADLKNSKFEKELKFWNFVAGFCFIRYWYWMSDSKVILDENTSQRTKPKT